MSTFHPDHKPVLGHANYFAIIIINKSFDATMDNTQLIAFNISLLCSYLNWIDPDSHTTKCIDFVKCRFY